MYLFSFILSVSYSCMKLFQPHASYISDLKILRRPRWLIYHFLFSGKQIYCFPGLYGFLITHAVKILTLPTTTGRHLQSDCYDKCFVKHNEHFWLRNLHLRQMAVMLADKNNSENRTPHRWMGVVLQNAFSQKNKWKS